MDYLERIKTTSPLVHCITNAVGINDVANVLIAIGASPIMADEISEVGEITTMAKALLLNIGTLDRARLDSMLTAAKTAKARHHPIVLDPVGVGSTTFRQTSCQAIMQTSQPTLLRGNAGEIATFAEVEWEMKGVDAGEGHLEVEAVKAVAQKWDTLVALSGVSDIITDGEKVYYVDNGCSMMSQVTATGDMLSAVCAAFLAVTEKPEEQLEALAQAHVMVGLAGERAYAQASGKGTGSFRVAFIDALSKLTSEELKAYGKIRSI